MPEYVYRAMTEKLTEFDDAPPDWLKSRTGIALGETMMRAIDELSSRT